MSRRQPTRILCLLAIITGLFLYSALGAGAATLNVPGDYPTIQAGIDAAQDGDTVLVGPGTYMESIDFMGKAISVVSSNGSLATVIEGNNNGPVVTIANEIGQSSVQQAFEGFTLRSSNVNPGSGGGIAVTRGSPIISGNIFSQVYGYVIYIWGGSPLIQQNTFINNSCVGQEVVAATDNSSPVIVNNIFVNNPCAAIAIGYQVNSAQIANNTIVGNTLTDIGLFAVDSSGNLFKNNIIVGYQIGVDFVGYGLSVWQNNLVYENTTNYSGIPDQTGTNGNISADPLFFDPANNDYHLCFGSPAIDTGDAIAGC
ncbi:MAG: right-handed parallel beta-helix repeat-containing protein [Syntrophobacteraceae bacterium]